MSSDGTGLLQLQQFVQQALLTAEGVTPAEIQQRIAPSQRLDAAQRLAIYRRGYYARLLECLGGQYKVLRQTLGPELFDDFAALYLQEKPSSSFTLSDLGAGFAAYLETTRPDKDETEKEPWIDFMIALGRFEWDVYTMFDKPGAEETGYATAETPDEQLVLQPAAALFRYNFPVTGFYHLASAAGLPEIPPAQLTCVALVRKAFVTGIFNLTLPQYFFLEQLAQGSRVAGAVAATALRYPEAAIETRWPHWKKQWAAAGFFAAG